MNNYIDEVALKKESLFRTEYLRYFARSMYAGLYLTLGSAVAIMASHHFNAINPAIGKVFYSLLFPWGLIMIIVLNGELATSNMMYLTNAAFRKTTTVPMAILILLTCTVFNLVGSMVTAFVLSQTTLFSQLDASHYLYTLVEAKLAKSNVSMLFDGVLANILVNIAVIGTVRIKENSAKILYIVGVMFIFSYFGFEHVIANFGSFSLVMFTNPSLIGAFTAGNVISHWLLVFIANYIGGGVIMGLGYAWLDRTKTDYLD